MKSPEEQPKIPDSYDQWLEDKFLELTQRGEELQEKYNQLKQRKASEETDNGTTETTD